MNTKNFVPIFALILCILQASSQAPIVRQNGNTTAFYNSVGAAVTSASNGDTVYIPGGNWDVRGLSINKTLHLFGTGHHPDSSKSSGITYLTGDIEIRHCSNGSLSGLYIQGNISSLLNDTIVSFSIRRCRFSKTIQFPNYFSLGFISENVFDGPVNGSILGGSGPSTNNGFYNNIFGSCVYSFGTGSSFKNNLFLTPVSCNSGYDITSSKFENNIFLAGSLDFISNSVFNNNLFISNVNFPFGSNLGSNNITNQAQASVLINQSGTSYNYSHNYHLQSTSAGIKAGTDGTDIGIYGGALPWKDGSIPLNPHVQFKNISGSTDQNGNLQINIKVKAQNN